MVMPGSGKMFMNPPPPQMASGMQRKAILSNLSVRFSPFVDNQIVVGQAQNFGIVGGGSIAVFNTGAGAQVSPCPNMMPLSKIETPDTTFDVCFSEADPNTVLSAGGDGTLKLWNL